MAVAEDENARYPRVLVTSRPQVRPWVREHRPWPQPRLNVRQRNSDLLDGEGMFLLHPAIADNLEIIITLSHQYRSYMLQFLQH